MAEETLRQEALQFGMAEEPLQKASKVSHLFPTAGWETIPDDEIIEEEQMEELLQRNCYLPVDIGDILLSRYQVVGKLGWGTTSTVWLVRDLE